MDDQQSGEEGGMTPAEGEQRPLNTDIVLLCGLLIEDL